MFSECKNSFVNPAQIPAVNVSSLLVSPGPCLGLRCGPALALSVQAGLHTIYEHNFV